MINSSVGAEPFPETVAPGEIEFLALGDGVAAYEDFDGGWWWWSGDIAFGDRDEGSEFL